MSAVKKIISVIGFIALCAVIALTAYAWTTGDSIVTVQRVYTKDFRIPEKMDAEKMFGLYFYNEDGSTTRSTEDISRINYDPEKPLILFIHGVQLLTGYKANEEVPNAVRWLANGYNVCTFFWSQLSDDSPFTAQRKVWGRETGTFTYENEKGERVFETENKYEFSMAETVTAYYLEFMEKYGFNGSQIRFTGLSMGANTLYGVANYLFALEKGNAITKEFFPDRMTFFDAYLDPANDQNTIIPWLGRPIGEGGSIRLASETVMDAKNQGITVEYIASSIVSDVSGLLGASEIANQLYNAGNYLKFDSSFLGGLDFGNQHVAGKNWYFHYIDQPAAADTASIAPNNYSVSPETPLAYSYARMGTKYGMKSNTTQHDYTDDIQFSINITSPKIAGFAFFDVNKNGTNDDRLFNRAENIAVELYADGVKVAETATKNGGYYEFNIDLSNMGKTYTVKARSKKGYTFAKQSSTAFDPYRNSVGTDGKSGEILFSAAIDLKIINIGIVKE